MGYVVETGGYGHVECIALVNDKAIANKFEAVKEVTAFIHKAGKDIERQELKAEISLKIS